eukprot:2682910-Pyramimonas_sp.AAC.1
MLRDPKWHLPIPRRSRRSKRKADGDVVARVALLAGDAQDEAVRVEIQGLGRVEVGVDLINPT